MPPPPCCSLTCRLCLLPAAAPPPPRPPPPGHQRAAPPAAAVPWPVLSVGCVAITLHHVASTLPGCGDSYVEFEIWMHTTSMFMDAPLAIPFSLLLLPLAARPPPPPVPRPPARPSQRLPIDLPPPHHTSVGPPTPPSTPSSPPPPSCRLPKELCPVDVGCCQNRQTAVANCSVASTSATIATIT